MKPFAYARPTQLAGAVSLLGRAGAVVLAGGTDLLSLMKSSIETPELLVDVKDIEDLRGIRDRKKGLSVGAAVTLAELAEHPRARELPAIRQAIAGIQSPQIRNMGTLGGELCQRPRCWYYRSGFGLLAWADGKSRVEEGDSRYHAIFGEGPARFVNPSSLAPALIALDARLLLVGPDGDREISVEDLYRSPRTSEESELALGRQELIREISIPAPASGSRSALYEVRSRQALDWPLVASAVSFRLDRGKVRNARVVLGHVAPTPWRCLQAEQVLEGQEIAGQNPDGKLDQGLLEKVSEAAVESARPLRDNGYKVELARVATRRALVAAIQERV